MIKMASVYVRGSNSRIYRKQKSIKEHHSVNMQKLGTVFDIQISLYI